MARSRHTLGHVFGREIEAAERWLGGAWSSVRRVFRWSRSRSARRVPVPLTGGSPVLVTCSAAPKMETAWVLPASLLASLGAHAGILALLLVLWIPGGPTPEGGGAGETRITFRLGAAPGAAKPRPAPLRIDPLPPPPPEMEPAAEDRRSPPPGDLAREDAVPEEPARGEPDGSGVDAGGKPRAEALPLPMGLGGSPPPSPGAGGGSLRGFDSRGRGKGAALRIFGGSGATEGAVSRGLRWLAAHQDEGGGWSAEGFDRHCHHHVRCGGRGMSEFDVGVTALAVLAFLGAGHVPESGPAIADPSSVSPYRRNVEKALDHLLSRQDGRGAFGATGDNYLYNHALATLAMAEAFAMTGASRHRAALDAALAFTFAVQQGGGGWDYTSQQTGRNDLSITGWQVMALRSAELAGVSLPDEPLERLRRYLDGAVTGSGEGIYANIGQEAGRRGINMVAVGLLSRLYMGAGRDEEKVRRAAERLLRTPPDWERTGDWERTFQSYYHWYAATLALFHLGGDEWRAWNFFVARTLPDLQSRKAHEEGSWPPEPSWVGASGGRVYATAVNVLTLETYYRYEPLHRERRKM